MSTEVNESSHPAAPTLEAIAAGEVPGSTGAHLEACGSCTAYVARLRDEAAAFRARTDATAFAEKIRARAAREPAPAAALPQGERGGERSLRARVVWIIGPMLAAAAAIVLWLRVPPSNPVVGSGAPSSVASGDVARFKGGLSVAVIRDRAGHQDRLTGPFEVEAMDRIRVEVAVDHDVPVVAGLLAADGTWTPLLAPTVLGSGTHYSELAARFDDTPTDALLIVGSPEDVTRARATRNVEGVVAWRVRSAPTR